MLITDSYLIKTALKENDKIILFINNCLLEIIGQGILYAITQKQKI